MWRRAESAIPPAQSLSLALLFAHYVVQLIRGNDHGKIGPALHSNRVHPRVEEILGVVVHANPTEDDADKQHRLHAQDVAEMNQGTHHLFANDLTARARGATPKKIQKVSGRCYSYKISASESANLSVCAYRVRNKRLLNHTRRSQPTMHQD